MQDIIGTALLDYYSGNYSEDILTETNISEEDELPLPYLFRTYEEMPEIEQKAMELAKGRVLDIGCGAGIHALYLQDKGLDVKAIDTSAGAIEVCKLQGIKDVENIDFLNLKNEKFDTLLLLMNGTGILKNLEEMPTYLRHLKSLLNPNGQILIDSSDLKYMYGNNEEIANLDGYYGELEFVMRYKGMESLPFDWLYLDEHTFEAICDDYGLKFNVVSRGVNYDYLAKITIA